MIGPVRHRIKGFSLRRKAKPDNRPVLASRPLKVLINEEALGKALSDMGDYVQRISREFETVDLSKIRTSVPAPAPQKPERKSMARRVRGWFTDKWYDEEWHDGAQRTAKTVLLWWFTAFSLLVFVKGALWVLSL